MLPVTVDICDIIDNNSIAVLGTDLFYDKEQEKPDDVVTIYAYSSVPSNSYNCDSPEKYFVQIRVRSKIHIDGWNKMEQITTLLNRQTYTVNGSPYDTHYSFVANTLPINIQQDLKNRHILIMNYSVTRWLV
jgi:hypothetical protein